MKNPRKDGERKKEGKRKWRERDANKGTTNRNGGWKESECPNADMRIMHVELKTYARLIQFCEGCSERPESISKNLE